MTGSKAKLILLGAELLAIVILNAIHLWQRDTKSKPAGARVAKVAGRPVYRFPFLERGPKKKVPQKEQQPYIWTPNPQFRRNRQTDPKNDTPETPST